MTKVGPGTQADRQSEFMLYATLKNKKWGIEDASWTDTAQDREQDREQDQIGSKSLVQVIQYCKYPKSRAELQEYCGLKGRRNFGQNYLTPLIEKGILKMTLPDKPTSKNQKYYSV